MWHPVTNSNMNSNASPYMWAIGRMLITLSPGLMSLPSTSSANFHRNEYDISVAYGRQLRGRLDGSLRLHRLATDPPLADGRPARARLDGHLLLDRAQIALALPAGGKRGEMWGAAESVPSPDFDVSLDVGHDVEVRGLGVVLPIAAARLAHLTGTLQRPVLAGAVSTGGGDVSVPAAAMKVTKANIDYRLAPTPGPVRAGRAPLGLSGDVDIQAEKLISDAQIPGQEAGPVQVMIAVEGRLPDDIRVHTWSDPPLSEEQLVAMLGARTLGSLTGIGAGESVTDALSQQALQALAAGFRATVFSPIETELARMLGLTEFTVSFGFNQAVSVRLGKYVLRDLLVSYQRSIGGGPDEQYTLSISYRLRDQLRIAYTTNELGESRVKVTYDIDM